MVLFTVATLCLLAFPGRTGTRLTRLRGIIDALLMGFSLFVPAWSYVILPDPAALVPTLVNVVVATAALSVLARWSPGCPRLSALALACAGLLTMAVADSLGLRAGWLAGLALIVGAVVWAGRAPFTTKDRPPGVVVPYVVVVVTLVAGGLGMAYGGEPTTVGTWCRFVTILLIVLRGVLLLRDNQALARRLEDRVAARTADLANREQRFRALVEQSSESLAILGPDLTVRYQSASVERLFGYPASAVVGLRLAELVGDDTALVIRRAVDVVLGRPGAVTTVDVQLPHLDGVLRPAEITITDLLDDPYVGGLVFNTRDVSEARRLQDRLRHEAHHDALTGLVNRAQFRSRLAAAAAREQVSVLFLDLDGFKEVNDRLGHAAGDELLVQVAARLRTAVPAPHTVARLGGDEFAVIVETPDARSDAEAMAALILGHLDMPFVVDDTELHVGAGIGLASAADATDIEQLQRNADLAMYKAKEAGGGVYVAYDPAMHDALVQRLSLADDLRRALDRAPDELVLHYQPTVDLRTGEITGFEALVRWRHPARGLVPPLDFIGIAESTGLIVPLGRWVLTEACRQAVAWGRPLRMAVNVSARQLESEDFPATVGAVLASTGMPADRLCLEMTESVMLTDTDENLARIIRLKGLGVRLAMDDFGTGYSSLAYLRRFPMDVLKIDRSFVDRLGGSAPGLPGSPGSLTTSAPGPVAREIPGHDAFAGGAGLRVEDGSSAGDTPDATLVRTIVRLGQRFGMETVAEGIEDAGQLAALREMGCDSGQGYLLSRPLPAAAAQALLPLSA